MNLTKCEQILRDILEYSSGLNVTWTIWSLGSDLICKLNCPEYSHVL